MRLILSSNVDMASKNILNNLLSNDWEVDSEFRGNPVYRKNDDIMVTVNEHHIYANEVDNELINIFGPIDHIVVISKHASSAGISSLTVHPIGNFGVARFGGSDRTLVPAAPHEMTTAFRVLIDIARQRGLTSYYDVSFEATHHGPLLKTPTYYIEIGSNEERWKDERAAAAIADTLLSVIDMRIENVPVALCIGGGHYAPFFTDLARYKDIAVGHIVPDWAFDDLDIMMFQQALCLSSAEVVIIDPKVEDKKKEDIEGWCCDMGIKLIDEL